MAKALIHGSFLARKEIYILNASSNQSSFGGWSGKVQFQRKSTVIHYIGKILHEVMNKMKYICSMHFLLQVTQAMDKINLMTSENILDLLII